METARTFRLSKSKLNSYRQCAKRLWLEVHRPELKVETDAMRRIFGIGHQVGEIARQDYPDGILIGWDDDLNRALIETDAALAHRLPLFEATLRHDDVLIRADLLLPEGDGWHMAEVKSTTRAKPYHVGDVATQVWVARGCGVQVDRASIRHIDKAFTLQTVGDYRGLFMDADVTTDVEAMLPELPTTVHDARTMLEGAEPDIRTGAQCSDPFECPFKAHCRAAEPPSYRYPRRKSPHILEAIATGVPYRDATGAAAVMDAWAWPRYFLDFGTIGPAVPIWIGAHPYEQAPFQFSCHVVQRDGTMTHSMFLDVSGADPSRACAEALLAHLDDAGAIVTYSGFERGCVHGLAKRFPDLAPQLELLLARLVDLLPVVRDHYYHRDMLGSYSIKAVLPALVPELSYAALDGVKDGQMAGVAWHEAAAPETSDERRAQIRRELIDYCTLDTLAMVRVAEELTGFSLEALSLP